MGVAVYHRPCDETRPIADAAGREKAPGGMVAVGGRAG
jgi:hypothetical protein